MFVNSTTIFSVFHLANTKMGMKQALLEVDWGSFDFFYYRTLRTAEQQLFPSKIITLFARRGEINSKRLVI